MATAWIERARPARTSPPRAPSRCLPSGKSFELSHRFVNMLQTLASGIQRDRRAHGSSTRENDLERLVASIHAAGQLHRYLLPSRTDLPIDLGSLLLNVAAAIEGAIGLQCHVDVGPMSLPNEVTMHLAAAVYELAWNAHKHAYAGKAGGVIRVVCRRDADRRVVPLRRRSRARPAGRLRPPR